MIALIDYGAGNVRSVQKALEAVEAEVRLVREPDALLTTEKIVLPGVGAFGDCMAGLRCAGLVDALRQAVEQGKPLLGICVGMQVLFEEGEEMGRHAGLGLLPGQVVRFIPPLPPQSWGGPRGGRPLKIPPLPPQSWGGPRGGGPLKIPPLPPQSWGRPRGGGPLKIPHTGWNQIVPVKASPLLHDLPIGAWAYFNHAYYCQARPEHTIAVTDYGRPFPSVVGQG